MKRFGPLLAVAAFVLCTAGVAFAQDYLSEVASALKDSRVYVAPGMDGTDGDTAASLQGLLTSDDNIVLVMLPESTQAGLGEDLSSFVVRLSNEIGEDRIIGLAVGNQLIGYSAAMPPGVAADMMQRADSVSNDSLSALKRFTRNVQQWQRSNPEAGAASEPTPSGGSLWAWGVPVLLLLLFVGYIARRHAALSVEDSDQLRVRTRFTVPAEIRDELDRIIRLRNQVRDVEFKGVLYQCCLDIERYFEQYSINKEADCRVLSDKLESVINVLDVYVKAQNHGRDFHDPRTVMKDARVSVEAFAEHVLQTIRSGNEAMLFDYNVDTAILKAQRYR